MANNTAQYGFRWVGNLYGMSQPKIHRAYCAASANFTVSGDATNLNLNVGDMVQVQSTGYITLAGGSENSQTSTVVMGIVMGFDAMYDANSGRMVRRSYLPSGVAYSTLLERQSAVLIALASSGVWECDVNNNTTATTLAGYKALIGENVDAINTPNDTLLQANPLIDIGSHATTSTLQWRIYGVGEQRVDIDYSGTKVKVHLAINKGQEPFYTATGT